MGLTLQVPPGYSDLSDAILAANQPALGIDLAKIYNNSAFGMVRTEVFVTVHGNGDTVPLPKSPIDGYAYSRNELLYSWHIQRSTSFQTGWITGADSLWYCAWLVDQSTGQVFSDEWYRRSGSHYNGVHTNDGAIKVFTIAQRQLTNLVMATSPSYSAITGSSVAQDKPLTQLLAQSLNDDAKFSVVNTEVFYLGEYFNGQTVPLPHSPADGHAYSSGECKFIFSWRWTTDHTTFAQPALAFGQMGPMKASVNSSGVVSVSIAYIDDNGALTTYTAHGRIAVFAFCTRSGTPGSISPAASSFAELDFDFFMPGSTLPFDEVVQTIIKNTQEAVLTPEYVGPTTYKDGDTIPVPTSAVDGYVYSRSELNYIYDWSDTTNQTGSNLRLPLFYGGVDQTTGLVTLRTWRDPPGGPLVDDDNTRCRISVIVVARRQAQLPAIVDTSTGTTPGSGSTTTDPTDVPTLSAPAFDVFSGNGSTTGFTLSAAPRGNKAIVFWAGAAVLPADYSVSGTAFTTSFKDASGNSIAAPLGDKIYVVYFT